jgi:hypothetical protein
MSEKNSSKDCSCSTSNRASDTNAGSKSKNGTMKDNASKNSASNYVSGDKTRSSSSHQFRKGQDL